MANTGGISTSTGDGYYTVQPITSTGIYQQSIPGHTHTYPVQTTLPHFPPEVTTPLYPKANFVGPIEGIDELCLMLGVEPTKAPTETLEGLILLGREHKRYSLVEIISAQLSIMQKLHVLLVSSNLTPESGE